MITEINACTGCQSELHPGDNFCQDCGASSVVESSKEEPAAQGPEAVLTCLNCGCQYSEPSSYCATCGSLMSDVGVYTTTVKALPQVDLKTVQPVAAGAIVQAGPARGQHLTSPLLKRNNTGEIVQKRLVYKSPALSHAIVDLSPGVLLLAFFALVVVWFIDYDRDRSQSSFQAVYAQAQSAAAGNKLGLSIETLDKLSAARAGSLTLDERALLNDSLFKRAQELAAGSNNKAAIFDLLRITPDFEHYADARLKLDEYVALSQAQNSATQTPAAATDKTTGQALEKTAAQVPDNRVDAKKSEPRLLAANEKAAAETVRETSATEQTGQSEVSNVGEPVSPPITNANHPAEAASGEQGGGAAATPVNWKYTDADVARYNKLLAEYFSSPRSEHQGASRRADGNVPDTRDPPTLREWLEQGKPNF